MGDKKRKLTRPGCFVSLVTTGHTCMKEEGRELLSNDSSDPSWSRLTARLSSIGAEIRRKD